MEMMYSRDDKEYIEELYQDKPLLGKVIKPSEEGDEDELGENILKDEFEQALMDLLDRKAAGPDDIHSVLI